MRKVKRVNSEPIEFTDHCLYLLFVYCRVAFAANTLQIRIIREHTKQTQWICQVQQIYE